MKRTKDEMMVIVQILRKACADNLNEEFSYELFKEQLEIFKQRRIAALLQRYCGHLSDADALLLCQMLKDGVLVPKDVEIPTRIELTTTPPPLPVFSGKGRKRNGPKAG